METDESDWQLQNQIGPIRSTGLGIMITDKSETENVPNSIRLNDDSESNEIDESESHIEKLESPKDLNPLRNGNRCQ
jgi:hypothetical protein